MTSPSKRLTRLNNKLTNKSPLSKCSKKETKKLKSYNTRMRLMLLKFTEKNIINFFSTITLKLTQIILANLKIKIVSSITGKIISSISKKYSIMKEKSALSHLHRWTVLFRSPIKYILVILKIYRPFQNA